MPAPAASSPLARVVAWLGGASFVAALATGAWCFGVVLAAPAPGSGARPLAVLWNVVAFTIFAGHHSVMARTRAKTWIRTVVPPVLERSIYVWVASWLFIALCLSWQRVPGVLYTATGWTAWGLWRCCRRPAWCSRWPGPGCSTAGPRRHPAGAWAGAAVRHPHGVAVHRRAAPDLLGWALIVFGASPMTVDRMVWALVSTLYPSSSPCLGRSVAFPLPRGQRLGVLPAGALADGAGAVLARLSRAPRARRLKSSTLGSPSSWSRTRARGASRNLEPLAARLTGEFVVDAIRWSRSEELGAVDFVGIRRHRSSSCGASSASGSRSCACTGDTSSARCAVPAVR
jgi:hypothetical protein